MTPACVCGCPQSEHPGPMIMSVLLPAQYLPNGT